MAPDAPSARGSLISVTSSGDPSSGAKGVSEPDWIDQILERATQQAGSAPRQAADPSVPPASEPAGETDVDVNVDAAPVPSPPATEDERVGGEDPGGAANGAEEGRRAAEPRGRAARTVPRRTAKPSDDGLAEIRWAETSPVTPAGTRIVASGPSGPSGDAGGTDAFDDAELDGTGLAAAAIGRSAWDADLAATDSGDPEGWDKLSWTDLDGDAKAQARRDPDATSFGRLLREWGPVIIAAVAIALFTRLVLVQAYHIPSTSMVPTLENGDRVVVNRLSYTFGEIERGQVVVFAKPPGTEGHNDLIKRVIGLPGETIRFVEEQVYIDGLRVEEPYLAQQNSTRPRLAIPGCAQEVPAADLCEIPDGYIFVMGDNRLGSQDSRVFGPVEIDSVVGRAFVRVWPLNNIGQL